MIRALLVAALLAATSCSAPEAGTAGGPEPWRAPRERAAALRKEGKLDEAAAELATALQLLRAAGGPALDRAAALEGLARTRLQQGDLAAAESLYVAALSTLTDTVGLAAVPGPRLVAVLGTLADLNQSLGRLDRAEAYYRRIGELTAAGWVDLGPTDLALAYTLAGQARVRRARGDSVGADSLAGRAMGINLLSQGYDLFVYERFEEAEPQLRRALALQERFLGARHPDAARSAHLLGRIAEATGRPEAAVSMYRRAAEAYRAGGRGWRLDQAGALDDLAGALASLGRSAAADSAAAAADRLRSPAGSGG